MLLARQRHPVRSGQCQVGEAVVVVVAHRAAEMSLQVREAGFRSDIGKRIAAIVAQEKVAQGFAALNRAQKEDVRLAIAIEVEEEDCAPEAARMACRSSSSLSRAAQVVPSASLILRSTGSNIGIMPMSGRGAGDLPMASP